MKPHVKIYMDFFGIGCEDLMTCELCGAIKKSLDVHHCRHKGMGGNKSLDYIKNLVGLCLECHKECHNSSELNRKVVAMADNLAERLECHRMSQIYIMENT
jgi:hypothetical protein